MRSRRSSFCGAASLAALFFINPFSVRASSPVPFPRPGDAIEAARQAYEISDYPKAVQLLQEAAARDPKNPEIFLLLAKSYNELQQHDQAIASAEKAVALDPQNSVYHEWLGRAYGDKAEHAGPFSGLSLAKKTRKEFDTAVRLDEKNYSAMKHGQPERLFAVANEGEKIAPKDPRGKFYRAVALILEKDNSPQPETLLREYLKTAPIRNGYPRQRDVHEWLGRYYENQGKPQAAITEYETALKLDPKSRTAADALKRLKKS